MGTVGLFRWQKQWPSCDCPERLMLIATNVKQEVFTVKMAGFETQ